MFDLPKNVYKQHHYFFGETAINLPTWEDIIINFDECISKNTFIRNIGKGGFVLHHTFNNKLSTYTDLAKELSSKYNYDASVHYYVSLSKESLTFGMHNDDSCVFFIGGLGLTEFTVIENNEPIVYIINPGDALYIPAGMYHSTKPLTPRVGISIGIDYEKIIV